MRKLIAMVLALGAILGTFEAGAALAGNGTKTDPYRIGSYGDLVGALGREMAYADGYGAEQLGCEVRLGEDDEERRGWL